MERLTSLQLIIIIISCIKEGNKKMEEKAKKILKELEEKEVKKAQ